MTLFLGFIVLNNTRKIGERQFKALRKTQCFWDFVAILAKRNIGTRTIDFQPNNAYPSFIVRLSFVIGSFILRDSFKVVGVWLAEKWADY